MLAGHYDIIWLGASKNHPQRARLVEALTGTLSHVWDVWPTGESLPMRRKQTDPYLIEWNAVRTQLLGDFAETICGTSSELNRPAATAAGVWEHKKKCK